MKRTGTECNGVQRSGTEWNGVERSGTEWSGVQRNATEWNGAQGAKKAIKLISNDTGQGLPRRFAMVLTI